MALALESECDKTLQKVFEQGVAHTIFGTILLSTRFGAAEVCGVASILGYIYIYLL